MTAVPLCGGGERSFNQRNEALFKLCARITGGTTVSCKSTAPRSARTTLTQTRPLLTRYLSIIDVRLGVSDRLEDNVRSRMSDYAELHGRLAPWT